MKREEKVTLTLDRYEHSIMIQALHELRNDMLANHQITDDVDDVLDYVNHLGEMKMWYDGSPIWLRPQYTDVKMYKSHQFLQVVGHTPMETITKKKNVISCDVFSTYRDGKPIGTEEFLLLDTITWDYSMVNYGNY